MPGPQERAIKTVAAPFHDGTTLRVNNVMLYVLLILLDDVMTIVLYLRLWFCDLQRLPGLLGRRDSAVVFLI